MNHQIRIIPADGVVSVDGRTIDGLDLTEFRLVHAVTWGGETGEVQRLDESGRIVANEAIDTLKEFHPALVKWEAARQVIDAPEPPAPAPTPEALFQSAIQATQQRLDDFAASRGYDGILSLCTYATDPDPVYAAEGQRGVTIRSTTWAALRAIQRGVMAGLRPMPASWAEVEAALPPLTWEAPSAD